jgi:hypothetical protein
MSKDDPSPISAPAQWCRQLQVAFLHKYAKSVRRKRSSVSRRAFQIKGNAFARCGSLGEPSARYGRGHYLCRRRGLVQKRTKSSLGQLPVATIISRWNLLSWKQPSACSRPTMVALQLWQVPRYRVTPHYRSHGFFSKPRCPASRAPLSQRPHFDGVLNLGAAFSPYPPCPLYLCRPGFAVQSSLKHTRSMIRRLGHSAGRLETLYSSRRVGVW